MLRQSTVTRCGVLCEFILLLLLMSTLNPQKLCYVSNDKWQRILWSVPFCRCKLPGRGKVSNWGKGFAGRRVFVQQKCRIVARLGIEHTSSFLMGFLCPTCGGRYDPRVCHHNFVRFAFRKSYEKNFMHFMQRSCAT